MKHNYIFVSILALCGAVSAVAQITLNTVPSRAVGTPALIVTNYNPNLVEGRELYAPQAVALDNSVSPPILYVSDFVNNRVLAWKNSNTFATGQTADLVIGQPDLKTTFPAGPAAVAQKSSTYSSGLSRPSGLAVDKNGNLYVADGGNNRVLRYPAPFSQTGQFPVPDLFIGQASLAGYKANYPTNSQTPTAQGFFLSSGSTVLVSGLAFDSSGNLWMLDTGNARILRFKAADLAGTGGGLTADLELGQPDLVSTSPALNANTATSYYNLGQFIAPAALAFDPNGNLFVADLNRVLVFPGPNFTSAMSASSQILGIFPTTFVFPTTAAAKQALLDKSTVYAPSGFFFLSGDHAGIGVVDSAYHRIMIFPPFASWPADGTPPAATSIVGQPNTCTQSVNQSCKAANNGNPQPSNSVFSSPAGAAYTATDVFVADAGNNRVLDLPLPGLVPAARVLGQDLYNTNSPNLIEGREFRFTGTIGNSSFSDAGIAIDSSSATPHLYVADPYNHRVLGFKDLRKFQNGAKNKADIVLGQADFTTALINYPSGDPNKPTSSSLYRPVGLLVDSQGNLYVADSLNSRVLRFPAPFAYSGNTPEPADLVLGQQNFTSKIPDPTASSMAIPYGLAFTPSCNPLTSPCPAPNGLVVSDQSDNRVLYIPTTNGTFTAGTDNGKTATIVFGQASFNAIGAGNTRDAMNGPHHLSCDTSGYIYVADTGNNRVLIFPDPHASTTPTSGAQASAVITGLNTPTGVFANPVTGEIWVANSGAGNSQRYANYTSVLLNPAPISTIAETSGNFGFHPLAAIQDQYGDLFVADDAHRVAIYYPGVNLCNAASFLPSSPTSSANPSANCLPLYDPKLNQALPPRPLAPGVIATIFPCPNCSGKQFLTSQNVFTNYPVPTTLGDVQVLFDGVASPLYIVYPGQINFIVPNAARMQGNADLEVVQASTGQVLGAAQVPMYSVAPGAFLYPGGQTGPVVYAAAINQDGTINAANNPAHPGQVVSLYMTGEGNVPGAPADGVPATAALSAPVLITVLINGFDVNGAQYAETNTEHVKYSGINGYPGMWQINVLIPQNVVPASGAVWFAVIAAGEANWDVTSPFKTYIYVK